MAWRWQVYHLLYIVLIKLILIDLSLTQSATTIPFPPTIVKQPPSTEQLFQVSQNQDEPDKPFMLECQAFGNPQPTYQWMKNGKKFDYMTYDRRISQQAGIGTLVFTKPDDIDEGIYQCLAENEHGIAVSNTVFLRKSELNSFADEESRDVYVMEGDPLTLDCDTPLGYPTPTLFWIIQSNTGSLRTINDSRITVDPTGNLHFSNVTKADALDDATYACSATSVFRNEYKLGNKITLNVEPSGITGEGTHALRQQYVSPANIVALRNKPLELFCIFGGTPLPTITWKKRGGKLPTGRIAYKNYGKTLNIRRVDFQDEGTYECVADNDVGIPQTHTMAVTVQASPYWLTSPNDTNAAEEEVVKFECNAKGIPEPMLKWFVNGVPLEDAEPNPRRKIDGNVLTIENLEKTDTAVYQCNASNVHGYAFADFYLNVLALPPTIIERPEPVTMAVVSSTVTLRCNVFGAPKPEIKWEKDGETLEGERFTLLENGDFQIKDVAKEDEGDYTCYASNKFGDEEAMGRLEVKVKTKIYQAPKNFEVAAGKSATFRCEAEVDPNLKLEIEWLFNDKPVDFDQDPHVIQSSDKSLTITKTVELDSGTYTCIAKTSLDEDRASAMLIVQDVPNPPKITGVKCEGLTALVEWQPKGDRQAAILGYTIQFNTSFLPDVWEDAFVNIPAPDTRFKVSMTPWANYTFRVIARNKIGPSAPSAHSTNCSTPPDVPYRNPDNVKGRGTRKDNLVISWTVMPKIEQNAPGFYYKVYWKRDDIPNAKWNIEEIKDWEKNELVIEDQPTFKPYRIKVEAHNEKGSAHVAATEFIGYSGEDEPKEAPKNFKLLYVKDARSAMFSWDSVTPESVRGHFKGYKIQTWTPEEGEHRPQEVSVQANTTQALVSIFRPFSRNSVRVRAFNEMYNGPASDVIEFNTPEGTPGPVANFDAIPMGSSALYLIWKKPLEPNGILTGYKIYYEEVNGTELGQQIERTPPIDDPREARAKLAGLHADTKYRVTIQATTSKGAGVPYFIETKTNKKAESAPDVPDLVWSRLPDVGGKAGIRVTWVPAVDGHPGSHFFVQYKKKGDTQWESTAIEENQDSVTIHGLELGSLYELKVIAVDGGFQTASKIEEIETGGLGIYFEHKNSKDKLDWKRWRILKYIFDEE
ncbi:neuroglian-like isoform X2 [Centruroides vittatus]|uniref:neuroglian-like isoform X2 n=2 Tax=Centruroides vittatus TaxID=120091 RepID=UPI00350F52D5